MTDIINDLIEAGIIPQQCTSWSLSAQAGNRPGKRLVMRTEVLISRQQFQKIADVLKAHPDEAKAIRETSVRALGSTVSMDVCNPSALELLEQKPTSEPKL